MKILDQQHQAQGQKSINFKIHSRMKVSQNFLKYEQSVKCKFGFCIMKA